MTRYVSVFHDPERLTGHLVVADALTVDEAKKVTSLNREHQKHIKTYTICDFVERVGAALDRMPRRKYECLDPYVVIEVPRRRAPRFVPLRAICSCEAACVRLAEDDGVLVVDAFLARPLTEFLNKAHRATEADTASALAEAQANAAEERARRVPDVVAWRPQA